MAKYLVSIVGGQTLPNILPIKEFETSIDKFIFIYTNDVINELEWIKNVCNLTDHNIIEIKVHEDDLNDINSQLSSFDSILTDSDKIFVNLTGGTKVMTLGTFDYFSEVPATTIMFYLKLGSNILRQVHPVVDASKRDTKIDYRVNVKEFLGSYGASISNISHVNSILKDRDYTIKFYKNRWSTKKILSRLRDLKNDVYFDKINADFSIDIKKFIKDINFVLNYPDRLTVSEIRYLTGGWWEEYCYQYVKEKYNLEDSFIGIGVQNTKTNNELDVVFVKENTLYVFECKTTVLYKDDFEDFIYKLSAIKDNRNGFGIGVKAYLVTNKFKTVVGSNVIDPTFKRRAFAFNIALVDATDLNRGKLII